MKSFVADGCKYLQYYTYLHSYNCSIKTKSIMNILYWKYFELIQGQTFWYNIYTGKGSIKIYN